MERRQGNGHSAKRLPQGSVKGSGKPWWGKQKSSKKVDGSRSVLEFESSGLGGWLDAWSRKGRAPGGLPGLQLQLQDDSDD